MTLRPIEEVVAELKTPLYQILDKLYADKSYIDCAYDDIAKLFRTTLAQRDAEWEAKLRNVPVGFVRQWINEDLLKDGHRLVTNEEIQSFINIALDTNPPTP